MSTPDWMPWLISGTAAGVPVIVGELARRRVTAGTAADAITNAAGHLVEQYRHALDEAHRVATEAHNRATEALAATKACLEREVLTRQALDGANAQLVLMAQELKALRDR